MRLWSTTSRLQIEANASDMRVMSRLECFFLQGCTAATARTSGGKQQPGRTPEGDGRVNLDTWECVCGRWVDCCAPCLLCACAPCGHQKHRVIPRPGLVFLGNAEHGLEMDIGKTCFCSAPAQ